MTELQLKIVFGNTEIFLQGDGELVCQLFSDIRKNGLGSINDFREFSKKVEDDIDFSKSSDISNNKQNFESYSKTTKSKKKSISSNPQLIKNLDLSGKKGEVESLKDFLEKKKPKSNVQITTACVYYLQNKLNIDEITPDHIFTCYKTAGYRMPNNLMQNLTDTCSSRYGYLSRKDGKYTLSVLGTNLIEFDLPKQE